jgi:nicotinate-nucleotide adenylyltransferase
MINKKIGLFFGTFDPIHNGHVKVAKYIVDNYFSDEVWLVITPQNPEKKFIKISNFDHRYKMAQIATNKIDNVNPSKAEQDLPTPNYTIDTLNHISEKYKNYEFSLIIGQDNFEKFNSWKSHERIIENYKILIYPRTGTDKKPEIGILKNIVHLEGATVDVSSSEVREKIENKNLVKNYLNEDVLNFIIENNLYEN